MYRPPNSGVPVSKSLLDVESTIRELTQDFCTAFNTGNYDQAARLYASDGVFMVSHRESFQGPKGIERALRELGELGYQNLRFETTRVDYSVDMAVEIGRYTVSIALGNTVVTDAGKFMRAWRRLGAWLIIGDSWNSSSLPVGEKKAELGGGTKVA
jgi:uncharacterized protein (TIGR02246 family)